jgi:ribosomal protein S18 acetylase RimI-like enzyme
LLAECERAAKQLGFNKVWLTVYYKNTKAIDFYAGQNFTHIGDADFVLGEDKHKNYIMLKVLSEKG